VKALLGWTEYRVDKRGDRPRNQEGSRTCKPNSVRNIAVAGRSFLWDAHCCAPQATYPEVVTRRAGTCPGEPGPSLFGLAPCGVCPARRITATAVRSYRTFSPLPLRAVCFLWHFPSSRLQSAVPDVIRHTALWSSDFPPVLRRATVRSSCLPFYYSLRLSAHGPRIVRSLLD